METWQLYNYVIVFQNRLLSIQNELPAIRPKRVLASVCIALVKFIIY